MIIASDFKSAVQYNYETFHISLHTDKTEGQSLSKTKQLKYLAPNNLLLKSFNTIEGQPDIAFIFPND